MSFLPSSGSAGVIDAKLVSSKSVVKGHLIDAIKQLQVIYKDKTHSTKIGTNEDSTSLLNALEGLFIHGLKDSHAGWSRINRSSPKGLQPNFWTYVLIFSHKDTIQALDALKQITSDVGRSRAWLRLALNEGLLSSYLATMIADKKSANRFYNRSAIMRDSDILDVITKYLTGIEVFQFDLALNSGLLNKWSRSPLVMVGLLTSDER